MADFSTSTAIVLVSASIIPYFPCPSLPCPSFITAAVAYPYCPYPSYWAIAAGRRSRTATVTVTYTSATGTVMVAWTRITAGAGRIAALASRGKVTGTGLVGGLATGSAAVVGRASFV